MTAPRSTGRLLVCFFAGALVATSCGSSTASDAAATISTTSTSVEGVEEDSAVGSSTSERSMVTADASSTTTSTLETTTTSTTGSSTADGLQRLAPARNDRASTFQWDRSTLSPLGHGGLADAIDLSAAGPLTNVVAIPLAGYAFQSSDERVIWHLVDGETEDLLVVPENERLTLEGAGLDSTGEPIVLYQRRVHAEPEDTRSSLVSHRLSDGLVTEIAVTGGWESGAGFPTLSPLGPDNGDTAVASWGAEGFEWLEIIDLVTGATLFDSQEVSDLCFDGEPSCPSFWLAIPFDDDIIGMGPVWNDDEGFVDAFGLWRYDTSSGDLDLMESWPWDNGAWYVEDMFVLDDSLLVVSLQDDPFLGDPLPPLFYDLVSGESWTLPEAAFVGPAFLS